MKNIFLEVTSKKTFKQDKPKRKSSSVFLGKRLLNFFLFLLVLLIFPSLKKNKDWLNQRIIPYIKSISPQSQNLNIEKRNQERHGAVYSIFNYVCQTVPKGAYILIPPQSYYLKSFYNKNQPNEIRELFLYLGSPNIFNYHCMDVIPITMYMEAEKRKLAKFALMINQKNIQIVPISSPEILSAIEREFNLPLDRYTNPQAAYDFLLTQ